MPSLRAFHGFVIIACATVLGGCTLGPDFHTPVVVPDDAPLTPATATAATPGPGGAAQRFDLIDAKPRGGAWWHGFGSDVLDHLVQRALDGSPTLVQARMRLSQAQQEYLAQKGGTALPQFDAKVSALREQVDPTAFGFTGIAQPPPFTLYSASVNVTYQFDLFGANRSALEGLAAQVDYERFEFDAARLSLAGNVVTTALRRASLAKQIALTQAIDDVYAQQLKISERRYRAGGISLGDLTSERTKIQQTEATLPPLRQQLTQANHQLAIYLGRSPATPSSDNDDLNSAAALDFDRLVLPTELPLTLPSAVARGRPDIRASEALLHAASADVGVATANLYPQITLSGAAGPEGTSAADLLKAFNVWNVGIGLAQPLFHGGQLRARQRFAQAAYEAAFASYRQTVLVGLEEVTDTLRALQHDADLLHSTDASRRSAHRSTEIATARYAAGGISQSALLDVQRQELQTALDRVKVEAQRYEDTAALYQALGVEP